MAGAETINLDRFLDEALGRAPQVTLFGKTWTLRPEMPALAMLQLRAIAEGETGDDTGTFENEINLLRTLLAPATQVDQLLEAGAGPTALTVLLRVAIGHYTGQTADEVLDTLRAEQAEGDGSPKG